MPKEAVQQLFFLVIGILILAVATECYFSLLLGIFLAVFFAIIEIQLQKFHEREAEQYSLDRLDNSQGMITTGKKSIAGWRKHKLPEPSLFHTLFDRWEISMYFKRIEMAKSKIKVNNFT